MTAEQKRAAEYLASMDAAMWYDNASHFSCSEANAIAEFLAAFGRPAAAELFLQYHGEDDDEGDMHGGEEL